LTEHIQRKNQCHGKNGYPGAISHNSIDLGFRKFSDFSPIPQKYRKKKSNTQIWLSEDHSFFHTFDSKSGSMKTVTEHLLALAEQIKESGAGTILDFIARMPGMSVVGRQVSYRGYRPGFMVDGRLEETVGEMNPVRAFRSTGMGRNHKTQTRLPPIPDPGGDGSTLPE
jgi:hypothetical protein